MVVVPVVVDGAPASSLPLLNAPATPSTIITTSTTTTANTGPQGFPLTEVQIDSSGDFEDTFRIRQALRSLLPRTQAVYVTLARKKVVSDVIRDAVNSGQPIIPVKGQSSFTGIVNTANASNRVIPIPLEASAGVRGSGAAALGLAGANQPFFQLKLTGVEQPPQGSVYIVWFVLA